jgi:hypothetical protein
MSKPNTRNATRIVLPVKAAKGMVQIVRIDHQGTKTDTVTVEMAEVILREGGGAVWLVTDSERPEPPIPPGPATNRA